MADSLPDSTEPAPTETSQTETSEQDSTVCSASEGPEPLPEKKADPDFGAGLLPLFLGLSVLVAATTPLSLKQIVLQFALPIWVLMQIVLKGLHWLRRTDRLDHGASWLKSATFRHVASFHAAISFLTFVKLEIQDIERLWRQAPDAWGFVSSLSLERLFLFSVDSLINGFQAFLWPLAWYREYGSETWKIVLLSWLIYRGILYVLKPWLPAQITSLQPPTHLGTLPPVATRQIEELDQHLEALDGQIENLDRQMEDLDQQMEDLDRQMASVITATFVRPEPAG